MVNLATQSGKVIITVARTARAGQTLPHVAHLPICGPLLVLSPALKRTGPSKGGGLTQCSGAIWASRRTRNPFCDTRGIIIV